jgi:hypothetical protein
MFMLYRAVIANLLYVSVEKNSFASNIREITLRTGRRRGAMFIVDGGVQSTMGAIVWHGATRHS